MSSTQRSGRRGSSSTAREDIALAARELFAANGYAGTTIRAIAEQAKVDGALVGYFYGSKRELFAEVVKLPADPDEVLAHVLKGPREQVGMRMAQFILGVLASDESRAVVLGLLRTATQDPEAAHSIRSAVSTRILEPLAHGLEVDQPELRASLAMSQVMGFTVARHVIEFDALAQAEEKVLIAALGTTLQRYLTEPLA